jgi:hypothetical protein
MGQLLHKFPGETAILGQICTKTANFTPDLGSNRWGLGQFLDSLRRFEG